MHPARQLPISVTVAPLGDVGSAVAWAALHGIRGIQLSATHPATRPRDLGASARRDLRAIVARHELEVSGIDLWIPAAHFTDPAHAERALDAVRAACTLASDLGRVPLTVELPAPPPEGTPAAARDEAIAAVAAAADHSGILVADAAGARACPWPPIGACIDPAALLAAGEDPVTVAARAGKRLVAARLVDLLRTGMRGAPGVGDGSRLDLLGYRIALETAGFTGLPVIDARQWNDPRGEALACARRWAALLPGP